MNRSALMRALLPPLLVFVLLAGCAADATLTPDPQHDLDRDGDGTSEQRSPGPEPTPAPGPAPAPDPAPQVTLAVVTRHTDGDTAHLQLESGAVEKVRFIGVDTPEVYGQAEPYGKEASAYTARAIPVGAAVWLETDAELRDRYGRLLAYIWLERPASSTDTKVRAKMLNARIVLDGYAQIATYPPNVRYVDYFTRYQTEARDAGRGLWALEANPANAPPAASAPAPGAGGTASGTTTVYITKTGEKYHADGCRYLSQSKISISLADAKARGYEPCKGCQPPQ